MQSDTAEPEPLSRHRAQLAALSSRAAGACPDSANRVSDAAIARVGASGSALFPHLHYQLQNRPDGHAEGLPSYFLDFTRIRGARRDRVRRGAIDSGDIVERAAGE